MTNAHETQNTKSFMGEPQSSNAVGLIWWELKPPPLPATGLSKRCW